MKQSGLWLYYLKIAGVLFICSIIGWITLTILLFLVFGFADNEGMITGKWKNDVGGIIIFKDVRYEDGYYRAVSRTGREGNFHDEVTVTFDIELEYDSISGLFWDEYGAYSSFRMNDETMKIWFLGFAPENVARVQHKKRENGDDNLLGDPTIYRRIKE